MEKPTIYTIAKQCGVSHATVSMALRNSPLVAKDTCRRIQAEASKIGYRPNRLALSLKTGTSNIIGCVVPSFRYPYYALIAEYIFREAARHGYQVQFVLSGNDIEQESRAITECLDAQVDGIIITNILGATNRRPEKHALTTVLKQKFPCVTGSSQVGLSAISLDHYQASVLAVRHLSEKKYADIRLLQLGGLSNDVSGTAHHSASAQSFLGFQQGLKENGITYDPTMFISREVKRSEITTTAQKSGRSSRRLEYVDYSQYEMLGIEMMKQVLSETKGRRLGVIFGQDQMACAAWRYCIDKNIRVPQDVGIVGRGNISINMLPLTTISWDYEDQARRLVSILLAEINSSDLGDLCPVEPQLVARKSTASI